MTKPDTLYATPHASLARFAFDEHVVEVFPDMIQRSVPGYATIIAMTGVMAGKYAQSGSNCYDLGSSLGASTLAMAREIGDRDCQLIGVDNSPAMIERCNEYIANLPQSISLRCENIQDTQITDASVVVLNFTLQFVPAEQRAALILKISEAMRPGGILILSEKIKFSDPHLQDLNTDLHHAFKRANGYSELEVAQKRSAIEDVLIPETLKQHQQRLAAAGFKSIDVWFQCFNFASLVAIK
ncbi:Carboxy-S-adenosyl-L-methionine synthase [Zhongshania aliphaticivorans]|uniref:Carboxy-S-adenosyl-L-methionine synthase n=1 Tax=Zhongshania aliphaticivorans TaxID=1470434 RepID=A0A5S9N583_9GAMM|nr:carboxy-S-adenosyl-L-methionine synthase CmoA [Zhongshania aliphaticivorans]CAA0083122.1 Carboxy-S-adenosyl-L-methionine synthase [Zhongshania aliphaticivorans]CAA0083678.1 Carboxy-S-adenosyl-L-methionine synthase [Zhongshania aliphaticivorans]